MAGCLSRSGGHRPAGIGVGGPCAGLGIGGHRLSVGRTEPIGPVPPRLNGAGAVSDPWSEVTGRRTWPQAGGLVVSSPLSVLVLSCPGRPTPPKLVRASSHRHRPADG